MRMVTEDHERILGGGEMMKKAVLYINQFFGQIGGEEQAGIAPELHEGQVGPAMQFAKDLDAEITYTIICGDNYMLYLNHTISRVFRKDVYR